MVQAGGRLGFLRETHHAIGIAGNGIRQNLQSDPAIEPGVPRQIDLSHAAGAEEAVNLVATESCTGIQYRQSMRGPADPIKRERVAQAARMSQIAGIVPTIQPNCSRILKSPGGRVSSATRSQLLRLLG